MTALAEMPGARMKNMGENTRGIKNEDGAVYDFWMTANVDGGLITKLRTQIVKDASKKAQFPGFRKGQIPPYAQPQMTMFAVQEGIIQTVESALGAFGLKNLPGSDGELDVKEELKELCKGYSPGDEIAFTGTFSAVFDPEKALAKAAQEEGVEVIDVDAAEGVIDAEAVVEAAVGDETVAAE